MHAGRLNAQLRERLRSLSQQAQCKHVGALHGACSVLRLLLRRGLHSATCLPVIYQRLEVVALRHIGRTLNTSAAPLSSRRSSQCTSNAPWQDVEATFSSRIQHDMGSECFTVAVEDFVWPAVIVSSRGHGAMVSSMRWRNTRTKCHKRLCLTPIILLNNIRYWTDPDRSKISRSVFDRFAVAIGFGGGIIGLDVQLGTVQSFLDQRHIPYSSFPLSVPFSANSVVEAVRWRHQCIG